MINRYMTINRYIVFFARQDSFPKTKYRLALKSELKIREKKLKIGLKFWSVFEK